MCLVWNSLLTNYDCFVECALLGGAAMGMAIPVNYMVQVGPLWGILSNTRGASMETLARQVMLPRVNLCICM
jgi:hypothetical protein